jgi:hypothetical protein
MTPTGAAKHLLALMRGNEALDTDVALAATAILEDRRRAGRRQRDDLHPRALRMPDLWTRARHVPDRCRDLPAGRLGDRRAARVSRDA